MDKIRDFYESPFQTVPFSVPLHVTNKVSLQTHTQDFIRGSHTCSFFGKFLNLDSKFTVPGIDLTYQLSSAP